MAPMAKLVHPLLYGGPADTDACFVESQISRLAVDTFATGGEGDNFTDLRLNTTCIYEDD